MHWSKYNHLYKSKVHDVHLLYNSLSNSFVRVADKNLLTLLEELRCGAIKDTFIEDTQLFNELIDYKVLVQSDELEIVGIKNNVLGNRYSPKTVVLTVLPTLYCNFKCPYCFANGDEQSVMSEEVETSIVNLMKNHYKHFGRFLLNLTWMGGEPLCNFKAIKRLSKQLMELDISYDASLVTNGYLLSKEKISLLKKLKISSIQITLDGLKVQHNRTRVHKTRANTFDKIMSNIDLLLSAYDEKDISLNIRVNLDKKEDYVKKFTDLYFYLKTRFSNQKNLFVSAGFIDNISVEGFRLNCGFERSSLKEFYSTLVNKYGLTDYSTYPNSRLTECTVRSPYSMVIGPKGELYPCWENIGTKSKTVGSLQSDGSVKIEDINTHNKYEGGADYLNDGKCLDCFFFPVCNGGCPEKRLLNHFEGTDFDVCAIQKDNLENILDDYYAIKTNK